MKIQVTTIILVLFLSSSSFAQYKEYKLSAKGDTINIIDKKGLKQGKWVFSIGEIRGEPGFEEEGIYKDNQKDGFWRKYSLDGDLLAIENYRLGGKEGTQQYYSFLGELIREESWRAFNPDAPYDTIPVYGTGSNEIMEFKIVKALPYSVKQGTWKYYQGGMVVRTEEWERNNLVKPNADLTVMDSKKEKPKKVEKTAEMLEWEKKNKGKKKVVRDGSTGM